MENKILEAAIQYAEKGFSVVPVGSDKRSLIKWQPYQKMRATKEQIQEWWKKLPNANVAIITGEISNLFVVDTDTSEATHLIQETIPDNLVVPCTTTPHGGMHFYFAHQEGYANRAQVREGIDIRTSGGYIVMPPSVNGNGRRWSFLKGLNLLQVEIPPLPEKIALLLKSLYNSLSLYRESNLSTNFPADSLQESTRDYVLFQDHSRNDDLFHIAWQLFKSKTAPDVVMQVIENLGKTCNPPWGTKKDDLPLKITVESAFKRAQGKERNLAEEVKQELLSTPGDFLSTDIYKSLHLSTREESKNLSIILKRLSEGPNPLIKKKGSRRGSWTTLHTKARIMNFVNVDMKNTLDIILPLDIHKKTVFFPKALIVLAGITGYGKTSFALNAIKENMTKWNIWYFNAEMSEQALHKKLSYFSDMRVDQWRMIAKDEWSFRSVADEIQPNDFNVIDYLEPEGDKSFDIHSVLSDIVNKLNKGVALVTIQKKPGSQFGTGGIYSAKAASLVLNLEWGTLHIEKNRFREEDPHPLHDTIDFDIVWGSRFEVKGDWYNKKLGKSNERYKDFTGG